MTATWNNKYNSLDEQRKKVYNTMFELCNSCEEWNALELSEQHSIIRKIERSCYNRTVKECLRDGIDRFWENEVFLTRYSVICNKVMCNIYPNGLVNDNTENKYYTLLNIINGTFNCDIIAEYSSYKLNPQCNEDEVNLINERKNIKVFEKISERKVCPLCKEKKTTFINVQTRSGDEPPAIKYKCTHCKNEWFGS